MTRKQIGAIFGAVVLAVITPLLVLALLHGFGGTARAQVDPHYACHSAPGSDPEMFVGLLTQFGLEQSVDVMVGQTLCAPAVKTRAGQPSEGTLDASHLRCFEIDEPAPGRVVNLSTQFADYENVAVGPAVQLCLPVQKWVLDPPGMPDPPPLEAEPHYKCYDISAAGLPSVEETVTVETQFFPMGASVVVEEPTLLCLPAGKNGAPIPDAPHEVCYNASMPAPGWTVGLITQFWDEIQFDEAVEVYEGLTLCMPAVKTLVADDAEADKDVMAIIFDEADNYPIEGTELDPSNEYTIQASENEAFSVTSVDYNFGPDEPADAEISFYAYVPAGCEGRWLDRQATGGPDFPFDIQTIDGDYDIPSSGTEWFPPAKEAGPRWLDLHFQTDEYGLTEPVAIEDPGPNQGLCNDGIDNDSDGECDFWAGACWPGSDPDPDCDVATNAERYTRFFEIHCYEDADYVFEFCNRADVKSPDTDPDLTNNLRCATLTVHSQAPTVEACCYPDRSCADVAPATCTTQGGTSLGQGSVCLGIEGCCSGGGSCTDADAACCAYLGETPQGPGSACTGSQACCTNGGATCTDCDGLCCDDLGGTLGGPVCLGDNNGNSIDDACETVGPEIKWDQLPDASPNGLDVGTLEPMLPLVLADDFLCTESGLITEIDFWASWYHDEPPLGDPGLVQFTLSLHSDVPAFVDLPYSHPGELLWEYWFDVGSCIVEPWGLGEEGWFDPPASYYEVFADTQIWLYRCLIPEPYWFQQEEDTIYWLDIQAVPIEPPFFFGWKTSIDHWNDDGVWAFGPEPVDPLAWSELRYPFGHPLYPESIDLAFQLWGQECDPLLDTDGDGFYDDVECYLPTDRSDDCPDWNGTPGLCPGPTCDGDDAWPLDNDVDTEISVTGDVWSYVGRIGATPGAPNWMQRLDIDMSSDISVTGDVYMFVGKVGEDCDTD